MEAHEIEQLRRAVAMLSPGQMALRREQAIDILEELAEMQARLKAIRTELRRLAES